MFFITNYFFFDDLVTIFVCLVVYKLLIVCLVAFSYF
jgi:hypothetical protein